MDNGRAVEEITAEIYEKALERAYQHNIRLIRRAMVDCWTIAERMRAAGLNCEADQVIAIRAYLSESL